VIQLGDEAQDKADQALDNILKTLAQGDELADSINRELDE